MIGDIGVLSFFAMTTLSGKVLGNGIHKVGCWHEDPDGEEDSEEGESQEAKPVDDGRGEFPLVAHRLVIVLVTEALGDVSHLLQDLGQLWLHAARRRAVTRGQEQLILSRPPGQPSAEDPGVGRGGGVLDAVQAPDADVEQFAVGGLGGWGPGTEIHAGHAGHAVLRGLVVTGRARTPLTRALHAQEPGAPVQQDHADLSGHGWENYEEMNKAFKINEGRWHQPENIQLYVSFLPNHNEKLVILWSLDTTI